MRDEATKDNGQTTAGMPFLLRKIFNFPFVSLRNSGRDKTWGRPRPTGDYQVKKKKKKN